MWKYILGHNVLKLGLITDTETVSMGHFCRLNNGLQRCLLPNFWNL